MRLLFVPLTFFFLTGCNTPRTERLDAAAETAVPGPAKEFFSITAVGDIMLGSDFPDQKRMPGKNILAVVADSLKSSDFLIGNLEGVITTVPVPEKVCKVPANCYAFRMPPGTENHLKDIGFDFLSLANNHSGDFGREGLKQTMDLLHRSGIAFAGIKSINTYSILKKNGWNIGVVAVGFGWRHLHINSQHEIDAVIKRIRDSTDVLIVYFHGGAEGTGADRVTRQKELFHGEDRGNMYAFARSCIDAGADMVIGSGPHVTRGMELYRNKLIAYSLGNFATFGRISVHGPLGQAPILRVNVDKNGDFAGGRIISTMQIAGNQYTPAIDSAARVLKNIRILSRRDFPESPLIFTQNGEIIF